jgi:integrase
MTGRKPERIKINKRAVDALKPHSEGKAKYVWDTEVKGFAVRVGKPSSRHPKGKRSYVFFYRNSYNKERWPKIGDVGAITPDQARSIAKEWAFMVAKGEDPQADREEKRRAISMGDFEEHYFDQYANDRKRPRSIKSDRTLFRLHVQPRLSGKAMEEITPNHVQDLHHAMKKTPGAANRTLALLSKCFNLAEKWGYRPSHSNPCTHVEKYPEHEKGIYLDDEQLTRLGEVMSEEENKVTRGGRDIIVQRSIVAAIRLLIFCGARSDEMLSLKWEQVDFDEECLRLTALNTKEKKPKTIHLAPAALVAIKDLQEKQKADLKEGLEKSDSPFVFRGRRHGKHLVNLRKPWYRIRAKAQLPEGTRIHDLRHSFASMGLKSGMSLPMIGTLLGHTQAQTTLRYAHLAKTPAKNAAKKVGNTIDALMSGKPSAEIIELKKV